MFVHIFWDCFTKMLVHSEVDVPRLIEVSTESQSFTCTQCIQSELCWIPSAPGNYTTEIYYRSKKKFRKYRNIKY